MFDIRCYRNLENFRKKIVSGKFSSADDILISYIEESRSKSPFIFNIETTNICNMKCIMCPRTKMMNRKIEVMDQALFKDIVDQLRPHDVEEVSRFHDFIKKEYGITKKQRSENAFYFYISATHLTLHGYGEPVLDPHITERVRYCSEKHIPTYFSCVPANIDIQQVEALMEAGLGVIKFSMDGLTDDEQKRIRGSKNNFTEAYDKIKKIIYLKEKRNLKTEIVITLINLSEDERHRKTKRDFESLWKEYPVYAYIKSQDNRWYYKEDENLDNRSHYRYQYCEFPWTSMTIMVDGSVVPCTQDYNTEMIIENVKKASLDSIWNSDKYTELRRSHIIGQDSKTLKCHERCDIRMLYKSKGVHKDEKADILIKK